MNDEPEDKRSEILKRSATLERVDKNWNTMCEIVSGLAAMQVLLDALGVETKLIIGVDGALHGVRLRTAGVKTIDYIVPNSIKKEPIK
jgi:hypothetical protein